MVVSEFECELAPLCNWAIAVTTDSIILSILYQHNRMLKLEKSKEY